MEEVWRNFDFTLLQLAHIKPARYKAYLLQATNRKSRESAFPVTE